MVYKVIAISGSLQKASCNTGLLRACIALKNPDLQIQILDISKFPHINPDLIENGKFPSIIQSAREKVEKADAVLFAIPQYNFRVSAPLKNAYDWISISTNPKESPSPLKQKIVGMISAGLFGGNQAQQHFVQIGKYCSIKLLKEPKIQIKRYEPGNFDEQGNLTSQQGRRDLQVYLKEFSKFISKSK